MFIKIRRIKAGPKSSGVEITLQITLVDQCSFSMNSSHARTGPTGQAKEIRGMGEGLVSNFLPQCAVCKHTYTDVYGILVYIIFSNTQGTTKKPLMGLYVSPRVF